MFSLNVGCSTCQIWGSVTRCSCWTCTCCHSWGLSVGSDQAELAQIQGSLLCCGKWAGLVVAPSSWRYLLHWWQRITSTGVQICHHHGDGCLKQTGRLRCNKDTDTRSPWAEMKNRRRFVTVGEGCRSKSCPSRGAELITDCLGSFGPTT